MPAVKKKSADKESAKDAKAPAVKKNLPVAASASATEISSGSENDQVKLPSIGTPPTASPVKKSISKTTSAAAALPNSGDGKTVSVASPPPATKTKPSALPSPKAKSPQPITSKTTQAQVRDKDAKAAQATATTPSGSVAVVEPVVFAPPVKIPDTPAQADISVAAVDALAQEEPAAAAIKAAAEAEAETERLRLKKENGTGMVKLIYEQYDELFPIVDGSTTQEAIDEVYCLSFVMPNCLVHLSHHPHSERFERENNGNFDSLVVEEPRGVYTELVKDQTYYVVVDQEADQLRRDQAATKAQWAPAVQQDKDRLKAEDGRGFESCSCIYGNPCVDEYGCKDWHGRFAIATSNGWKGF